MQKTIVKQMKKALLATGNLVDHSTETVTIALSISDHKHRAHVEFIRRESFAAAWDEIAQRLVKTAPTSWVRLESVQSLQRLPRAIFEDKLAKTFRMNYWRSGISFDADLKTALLEMEVNGQAFFRPSKEHKIGKNRADAKVDYDRLIAYMERRNGKLPVDIKKTEYVWTFTTAGIFTDGQQVWTLSTKDDATKGIRTLSNPKTEMANYIDKGQTFLINQGQDDGKFIYGYYPGLQKILTFYNMLRHFSTVYALLETIEFTGRTEDLGQVKKAIQWGVDNALIEHDGAVFINDNDEIKLGSQALFILSLCKYQEVTKDETFEPYLKKAFKGVPYNKEEKSKLDND